MHGTQSIDLAPTSVKSFFRASSDKKGGHKKIFCNFSHIGALHDICQNFYTSVFQTNIKIYPKAS